MWWSCLCFDVNAQSFSGWQNVAAAMLRKERCKWKKAENLCLTFFFCSVSEKNVFIGLRTESQHQGEIHDEIAQGEIAGNVSQ